MLTNKALFRMTVRLGYFVDNIVLNLNIINYNEEY